MPDVLAQDDVLGPGSDVASILSGSRYDAGPVPVAGPPPPAAAPAPVAQSAPGVSSTALRQDLQPQIADERRLAQAAFDKAERAMSEDERIIADKSKTLQPLRERMMDLASRPLPEREKDKEPPPVPKRNNQHDDENWLFAAGLLGALAGAFTRNHATNALAAFQGALQGYQEGSKQKFDEQMKIWEAENKKVLETNKAAQDRYRDILQDRKLNMDQMSVALQVAGQEFDDQGMITAARTKNSLVIAQYHDQNIRAMQQMQTSSDRISLAYDQMQSRERAAALKAHAQEVGVADPQAMQAQVDAIYELRAPPAPPSRKTGTNPIMQEVYRQHPDYDATKFAPKQRVINEFAAGATGRQIQSLNVAIGHLDVLKGLGDQLENRNSPTWNFYANIANQELGYPAPDSFDAVKQIVAAEVMKSIVPGGGGVSERMELAKRADSSRSPDQLRGVIRAYQMLLAGQMDGFRNRYEHETGLKDFDQKIAPRTKQAISDATKPPPQPNTFPMGVIAPRDETTGERDWMNLPGYGHVGP